MYPTDDSLLFIDKEDGIYVFADYPVTRYDSKKLRTGKENDFSWILLRVCSAAMDVAKDYPCEFDQETIYFTFFNNGERDPIVWVLKGPISKFKKVTYDFFSLITLTPLRGDKAEIVLDHFKGR